MQERGESAVGFVGRRDLQGGSNPVLEFPRSRKYDDINYLRWGLLQTYTDTRCTGNTVYMTGLSPGFDVS